MLFKVSEMRLDIVFILTMIESIYLCLVVTFLFNREEG